MDKRLSRALLATLLTLAAASTAAAPATVYRSVDDDGNVSFSDSPPADDRETQMLQIQTAEPAPDTESRQRLQDMRETTDRMAADRREREQHRAELRQQATAAAASSEGVAPTPIDDYYDDLYYPGYYPYPVYYRGTRYHQRHRPVTGTGRPPMRPSTVREGLRTNSQLMRPILPRR